ncbi:hypothetical protein M3Y97_00695800 [Aphelenchoides bicaudatus]|nr:hypothetical protein M3Y97_00695800 [Aphelenchoides bicaudatus]
MHNGRQEFGLVFFCSSDSKLCSSFLARFLLMRIVAPNWSIMLEFYSVDCAEKLNKDLCKKHGYLRTPVFKYYKPQSSRGDLGQKIPAYSDPDKLLIEVVKKINEDYPISGCVTCPNLKMLPAWVHEPKQLREMSEDYCVEQILLVPVESMDEIAGITTLIHAEKSKKKAEFPVWRVLKSNTQLLDPHNIGEPIETGHVVSYQIDADVAEQCRLAGGRMNFHLDPNKRQLELGEFKPDKLNPENKVNGEHVAGLLGVNAHNSAENKWIVTFWLIVPFVILVGHL